MKLSILILAAGIAFAQTTRYPAALDNDSSLFVVSDNVQSSLTSAMGTGDTAAVVSSGTGFVPNMVATICDTSTNTGKCTAWEHMLITAVSGNVLTVTRAFAGTTARSHSSGRLISALIDSAHQKVLKDAVVAMQTALGPNLSNIASSGPLVNAASFTFLPYSCNSSSVCVPSGPSGMALVAGNNSLTMTPVPPGVNGSDTGHALYVSGGTGAAEACMITGGSGTSGQGSGQIIINCANTHSGAWTLGMATGGIQEAVCSLRPAGGQVVVPSDATLRANVTDCGKTSVSISRLPGAMITGAFTVLGYRSTKTPLAGYLTANAPTWTNTDHRSGYIGSVGGADPVTTYQAGQETTTLFAYDGVDGVVDIPSTSTQWEGVGIFGGVRNASTTTNAVGGRFYGFATASGTNDANRVKIWAINTLLNDGPTTGHFSNVLLLNEWDYNINDPSTKVLAHSIGGASTVQPAQALGYTVNALGGPGIKWDWAFGTLDGTATVGLQLGGLNTGNNTASQPILMFARSSGGTSYLSQLQGDAAGTFNITSSVSVNLGVVGAANAFTITAAKAVAGVPVVFPAFNVATLPAAASANGGLVLCIACTANTSPCTNGGANVLARSTGTQWNCGSF